MATRTEKFTMLITTATFLIAGIVISAVRGHGVAALLVVLFAALLAGILTLIAKVRSDHYADDEREHSSRVAHNHR